MKLSTIILWLLLSVDFCHSFRPEWLQRRRFSITSRYISEANDVDTRVKEYVRYRCRISYDGSGFHGMQIQNGKRRTVQGELEAALSRRFNHRVRLVAAGRTDACVHARGQAAHFDILRAQNATPVDTSMLEYSLNSMLPDDIRVWNISEAPKYVLSDLDHKWHKWHVIANSKKKLYSYRFTTLPALDPLQRFTRTHVFEPICVDTLQRILKYYEGVHDFRTFATAIEANQRKKGKDDTNTVRTVYSVDLVEEDTGMYRIDVLLEGALYKMVRNMVGTALEVCKLKSKKRPVFTEKMFLDLLYQRDSSGADRFLTRDDNPCKPAPPEGLTLEWVYYDDF